MADIGRGNVEFRLGLDLNRLGDGTHGERNVFADGLGTLKLNARIDRRFESGVIDRDRIRAEYKRRSCVSPRAIGGERCFNARLIVAHFDFGARDCGASGLGHDSSEDSTV